MRCNYLLRLLILLAVSAPWSATVAQQRGDRITTPYKAGTVRVTARFTGRGTAEGFGFIVGERDNDLFLVTANHVIERGVDRASTIEIRFSTAPDEPYQARWLKSKPHLDLALLKINNLGVAVQWRQASWCSKFRRGDKVWFIGRDRKWFVPLDREAGELYTSEPDEDDRLQFSISSIRPGTSGAPLIHENGIVGMIIKDQVNSAQAISANKIRRFVKGPGYPWQLQRCGDTPATPEVPVETLPPQPVKIPFTVKTIPGQARVRILNIGPKYQDGMELKPGKYHIEVTKAGYSMHLSWIELTPENRVYTVKLERPKPIPSKPSKADDAGPRTIHCDEEAEWRLATQYDNDASYRRFLDMCHPSKYSQEARRRLSASGYRGSSQSKREYFGCNEEKEWKTATTYDNKASYLRFLDICPNSRYRSHAFTRLRRK